MNSLKRVAMWTGIVAVVVGIMAGGIYAIIMDGQRHIERWQNSSRAEAQSMAGDWVLISKDSFPRYGLMGVSNGGVEVVVVRRGEEEKSITLTDSPSAEDLGQLVSGAEFSFVFVDRKAPSGYLIDALYFLDVKR